MRTPSRALRSSGVMTRGLVFALVLSSPVVAAPFTLATGGAYETECISERMQYDPVSDVLTSSVRQWDRVNSDPDTKNRCEAATWRRPFPAGKTLTSSFAFRVGGGAPLDRGKAGWVTLHQWKGVTATKNTGAAGVFGLELGGPKLDTLRVVAQAVPSVGSPAVYIRLWDAPAPIKRDAWISYRDEVRFDLKGCVVRVWIDGKLVVDRAGVVCGQGDAVGYYAKYGVYRSNMAQTLRVDYRGIRDAVAP